MTSDLSGAEMQYIFFLWGSALIALAGGAACLKVGIRIVSRLFERGNERTNETRPDFLTHPTIIIIIIIPPHCGRRDDVGLRLGHDQAQVPPVVLHAVPPPQHHRDRKVPGRGQRRRGAAPGALLQLWVDVVREKDQAGHSKTHIIPPSLTQTLSMESSCSGRPTRCTARSLRTTKARGGGLRTEGSKRMCVA